MAKTTTARCKKSQVIAHCDKNQVIWTLGQFKKYQLVRQKFESLCIQADIPVPTIGPAYLSDPCDFTSPELVRLNIPVAERSLVLSTLHDWVIHYAAHTFGHYVCGLEGETNESDKVADLIASFVE